VYDRFIVPVDPSVSDTAVGTPGALLGIAEIELLAVPPPAAFTARTVTGYEVPLTSEEDELLGVVISTYPEVAPTPSVIIVKVFQLTPPSVEY
jgi:hypothetical protein